MHSQSLYIRVYFLLYVKKKYTQKYTRKKIYTQKKIYTYIKRLAVYLLHPTKLPKASEKHSGDEQTKDSM